MQFDSCVSSTVCLDQAFNTLANQAQQLHEEFLTLQRKGIQLAGDGRQPMLEALHGRPWDVVCDPAALIDTGRCGTVCRSAGVLRSQALLQHVLLPPVRGVALV